MTADSSSSSDRVCAGESVAGLMPMTASPQPCSSPSSSDAVTPTGSSVGWLGCSREARRPGRPSVLRSPVTARAQRPTGTRSTLRMSFDVAATISGVTPFPSPLTAASSPSAAREQPLAELADRLARDPREGRAVVGVEDEPGDVVVLRRDDMLVEEDLQRHVGEHALRRHPLRLRLGSAPGEHVAGARRRRLGEQVRQRGELVGVAGQRGPADCHRTSRLADASASNSSSGAAATRWWRL
jgi:hypothetical protein